MFKKRIIKIATIKRVKKLNLKLKFIKIIIIRFSKLKK